MATRTLLGAWWFLLQLELNLSVVKKKRVVEPNRKSGAHQNCHPANTVRRCH